MAKLLLMADWLAGWLAGIAIAMAVFVHAACYCKGVGHTHVFIHWI